MTHALDSNTMPNDAAWRRLQADLGHLWPVLSEHDLFLTGGYLVRVAMGLPTGSDVDVVGDVDSYSALRSVLTRSGYTLSKEVQSTGFRSASGADPGVYFREKWDAPPGGLSVDCLVLITDKSHNDSPTVAAAALAFIATYDCNVGRQLLRFTAHGPWWYVAPEAAAAMAARSPGWIEGAVTHPERRARWDGLLPGREVSGG